MIQRDRWVSWKTDGNHWCWKERKKKKGHDDSLRHLWDKIKCTNSILGAPEGKEKERKGQRAYLGKKTRDLTPGSTEFHTGSAQRGAHQDIL